MKQIHRRSRIAKLAGGLSLGLLLAISASCAKKPPAPVAAAPPPAGEQPARSPELPIVKVEEPPIKAVAEPREQESELDDTIRRQNQGKEFLKTVYFDFDKAVIRDDQVAILRQNAVWLKANPKFRLLIEGHCDERDTIDYNLALGERRAIRVLEYLADLGVPSDRIRKVSYGKERPADQGHDEEAWSKNRRAEFVLEK